MARSQTNTARLEGLRPGMVYVVQVRARTVAGYGKYSGKMCFQTLTDGESGPAAAWGRLQPRALVGLKELVCTELCPSRQRGRSRVIYGGVSLAAGGRSDPLSISQLQVFPAVYFCLCCLELWGQKPLAPARCDGV